MPRSKRKMPPRKPRKKYQKLTPESRAGLSKNPQFDTPEQRTTRINGILALCDEGYRVEDACAECGVTFLSFWRWLNNSADLMAEWELMKKRRVHLVKDRLSLGALKVDKDPKYARVAHLFMLVNGELPQKQLATDEVPERKFIFVIKQGEHKPQE